MRLHPPLAEIHVTSPFGPRRHPITGEARSAHHGIDLRATEGTPVLAAADGQVVRSYLSVGDQRRGVRGYGERIVLLHVGGVETSYAHLSRRLVSVGDAVRAGQTIGLSGGTPGTLAAGASTGPHLHFECKVGGKAVDPMPLFHAQEPA